MRKLFIFKKAYSMESPNHYYKGILVDRNLIINCLDEIETNNILKSQNQNFDVIDFSNYICLPGFFDSHTHFMQTGYNLLAINLTECKSIDELKQLLSDSIKKNKFTLFKNIIIGHGFDETKFYDQRFPTIDDLNEVSKTIPIFISRIDHHSLVVNTKFLEYFDNFFKNINKCNLKDGILKGEINYKLKSFLIDKLNENVRLNAYKQAENLALQNGITTVCALEGGAISGYKDVKFINKLIKNKLNKLNLILFNQSSNFNEVISLKLPRIGGCLLVDGSIGSMTAKLSKPYKNKKDWSGYLYLDKKFLIDFIKNAQYLNLQTAFHAIGDLAIKTLLDAYEVVFKQFKITNNYLRHRIEHFELASLDDIKRAANLNIVLSMQPTFEILWGGKSGMYAKRLGVKRALSSNRFATIINYGGIIAGGSDSDVTLMSPLLGIKALLTLPNENERLDIYDAVSLFTKNGAYANFLERTHGTISVNKFANFTVLSEDIFLKTDLLINDKVSIIATIINGNVYNKNNTNMQI